MVKHYLETYESDKHGLIDPEVTVHTVDRYKSSSDVEVLYSVKSKNKYANNLSITIPLYLLMSFTYEILFDVLKGHLDETY